MNSTRKVDKMERNKYIEVIDHYNRLLKEGTITCETAWWAIQAVILCAMRDLRITVDDYSDLLVYRDRLFE